MAGFVLPSDAAPDPTPTLSGGSGQPAFTLPSDADTSTPPSTLVDVAKAAPSGLAQGTADLLGTPRSIHDVAQYGADWLVGQTAGRIANYMKSGSADAVPASQIAAQSAAVDKQAGTDQMQAPSAQDVRSGIESATGPLYQAQTGTGQFVQKAAEFLPSSMIGPGGLAAKGAMAAGSAAGDMAAGAATDGTWLEPYARTAGALAGGIGGAGLVAAGQSILPAISNSAAEQNAAKIVLNSAHDPQALRANMAADTGTGEIVPGSLPTSFQRFGDVGLGDVERAVNTRNPQAFVDNRYGTGTQQQNAARVTALQGLQGDGDPTAVADLFRNQKQSLEDFHDQISTVAAKDAQTQADALGGNQSATQTGQTISNQVAPQFRAAQDTARSQAAGLGGTAMPDAYGTTMRTAAQNASNDVKSKLNDLFDAVPNAVSAPIGSLKQFVAKTYDGMEPAVAATVSPREQVVAGAINAYPDNVPFKSARAIDSLITSQMRAELSKEGRTQAYGRLTQLKGAWEDAMHGALTDQAGSDADAVAAGTMAPEDTIGSRLQAATSGSGSLGSTAYTPAGTKIGTDYGVADLSDLTASHTPDLQSNPAFPSELQPRDRSRATSSTQVADIASNLQPERLGYSSSTTDGAPIVGPDGVVESGNGRVLALHRAYDQNGPAAASYRQFLEGQGYDLNGLDRPVLVRQRTTPMSDAERVAFAQESNAPSAMTMSAPERAAADAGKMPDDMLGGYQGGDIANAANRPFVRNFMAKVAEPSEVGSLASADGSLSLEGQRRINAAMLHAGYGDSDLVSSLTETGNPDIAAFGRSLQDNAGRMAQLRRDVAAGRVDPAADVSNPSIEAARVVQRARALGQPVGDAVRQSDAFNPISNEAKAVLQAGYGEDYGARLNRSRLNRVLGSAIDEAGQQTTEGRLFGEPLNARQILEGANARYGTGTGTANASSFGAEGAGAGYGEGGNPGRGFGSGAQRPAGSGEGTGGSRVLAEAAGPPIDQAALDALTAAKEGTKYHVATFRKGPVGKILRNDDTSGNYKVADAAVPDAIFPRGPLGNQAVTAYKKAVGDDTSAAGALHNYAAATLRKAALNDDGTLDPAKYARWRQAYDPAIRALPQSVQDSFATAGNAAKALTKFGKFSPSMEPWAVPDLYFHPGPSGGDGVKSLRGLIGDQNADAILSDHAASLLKAKAANADGSINPRGLAQFMKSHQAAMDQFPDLAQRFSSAAKASQTVGEIAAGRATALKNYQQTIAGKFLGMTDPTEVRDAVGRMIGSNNVTGVGKLVRAAAASPDAAQGVKRAAVDYLLRDMLSPSAEAGASGVKEFNKGTFQNLMNDSRPALSKVLDPQQMNRLTAISQDIFRSQRTTNALKMKGTSNTAPDAMRAVKFNTPEHGSLLNKIFEGAVAGEELGGEHGAMAATALAVGSHLKNALSDAGMRKTYDVLERMVLDPEFMKAIVAKAPIRTGTGSEVTLTHRLAPYSMFRGLSGQQINQQDQQRRAS